MAETKTLKRCAEKITLAVLTSDCGASYILGGTKLVMADANGKAKDGIRVEAMALHPVGLFVIPCTSAWKGKRFLVPYPHVVAVEVAAEEQ